MQTLNVRSTIHPPNLKFNPSKTLQQRNPDAQRPFDNPSSKPQIQPQQDTTATKSRRSTSVRESILHTSSSTRAGVFALLRPTP
ncbi:hypothetical protein M011DRAFT_463411 [Sporormia fimetaria CBS 119925]|uniref:Uncharacterized protein n=1 Tax=Sporormia fimetaria CBS 119925 TaxID=1340428 RepID=A0A6A6VRR0_9PLEO|nr:hypothetical protein M011DRAFT_463411 [Sporormia fimetaria CBS 119925]